MKSFWKRYRLELALAGAGFLAGLAALPFLPGEVPRQWHDGRVAATMPRAGLFLVPAAQLVVTLLARWWAGKMLAKSPSLGKTLGGADRVFTTLLAVVCLSLEACILLAAWGVPVRLEVVLIVELLAAPLILLGYVMKRLFTQEK